MQRNILTSQQIFHSMFKIVICLITKKVIYENVIKNETKGLMDEKFERKIIFSFIF